MVASFAFGGGSKGMPGAFKANARKRYQAMLRESKDILAHLPAPGESLHALMSGYYDFMTLIGHVITTRPTPCCHLRIATLAFSARNTSELSALLDTKVVLKLSFLCSDFFEKHNAAIWNDAQNQLVKERGQSLRSARCHAKVALLHFGEDRFVFEGSANLRTNRNIEQFCLFNDAALHDWHAAWMNNETLGRG